MFRSLLLRFGIPFVVAISMVAYIGVPYVNRLLSGWFSTDIALRAQLVMNSVKDPLDGFLTKHDEKGLGRFLTRITADQRVLAILICRPDGTRVYQTALTPPGISCDPSGPAGHDGSHILQTRTGSIEVSTFDANAGNNFPYRAVIIHDLSFVDRRQSTARNYVLALAGISASILALLLGAGAWLVLRRWIKLLLGDIRALRFLDDPPAATASEPILSQVRQVLREIEQHQRLEIDFHENWTPQALQQVVRDNLRSPEIIVVSNREPYVHNQSATGPVVQVPASGMVSALEPIMRACSGVWIAHGSGSADRDVVDRFNRVQVPPDNPSYTLRRVWLTPEEEEGYYYGFSNEGLWPLCHLAYVRPAFRDSDWRHYSAVNERFAEAVARESRSEDPLILIQDYHFALLPQLVRRHKPKATIALFWHIPWPNAETFGVCPWKHEVLVNMLSADILGFHTRLHCQNFLASVDRFVECQIDREHLTVTLQGHVCHVAPYPISIEWPPRWLAQLPDVASCRKAIQQRFSLGENVRIALGVERWDFTKGIIERFLALEELFDRHAHYRGHMTLLQVSAPTRGKLPAYHALQERTLLEAQRINDKFATSTWRPIILINEHQAPLQVFELYRAADFCIVNSLHDGMNLVAKEFVAARDDEDGVLVLSTFAGASRELVEAILINPFDVAETAAAFRAALEMPRDERRERMRLMRRTVKENNVYRWAGRMLMDAARIRQRQLLSYKTRNGW